MQNLNKSLSSMKQNRRQHSVVSYTFLYNAATLILFLFLVVSFIGCKKENTTKAGEDYQTGNNQKRADDLNSFYSASGLSQTTLDELQQVKAATAKYSTIKNAFNDGYADIGLKLENMGYHFLKSELVTPVFNVSKPPILVYNKKSNGNYELVAVEYAIPIDPQSPHTPPKGFTGDADEWDFNTLNTGWWTLHAWIWEFNPDGVFKPMNPLVIVK